MKHVSLFFHVSCLFTEILVTGEIRVYCVLVIYTLSK